MTVTLRNIDDFISELLNTEPRETCGYDVQCPELTARDAAAANVDGADAPYGDDMAARFDADHFICMKNVDGIKADLSSIDMATLIHGEDLDYIKARIEFVEDFVITPLLSASGAIFKAAYLLDRRTASPAQITEAFSGMAAISSEMIAASKAYGGITEIDAMIEDGRISANFGTSSAVQKVAWRISDEMKAHAYRVYDEAARNGNEAIHRRAVSEGLAFLFGARGDNNLLMKLISTMRDADKKALLLIMIDQRKSEMTSSPRRAELTYAMINLILTYR